MRNNKILNETQIARRADRIANDNIRNKGCNNLSVQPIDIYLKSLDKSELLKLHKRVVTAMMKRIDELENELNK